MALLSGRAMGNHWKAPHGYISAGPISGSHRRDVVVMMDDNSSNNNNNNENLKEIEVTLNVRIWLNDMDMDSATYQELFDLLRELNSN